MCAGGKILLEKLSEARQGGHGRIQVHSRNGKEVGSILTLSLFPGDLICSEAPETPVTSSSRKEITA